MSNVRVIPPNDTPCLFCEQLTCGDGCPTRTPEADSGNPTQPTQGDTT